MILVPVPWLPSFGKKNWTCWAITIAPFVFILKSKKDDKALLAHEATHIAQAKEMGWWRFYTRYIFDLNFRSSVEAVAYSKQREVENA